MTEQTEPDLTYRQATAELLEIGKDLKARVERSEAQRDETAHALSQAITANNGLSIHARALLRGFREMTCLLAVAAEALHGMGAEELANELRARGHEVAEDIAEEVGAEGAKH